MTDRELHVASSQIKSTCKKRSVGTLQFPINDILMHQSIPAVPIPPPPPRISRAFAHVSIPGVGHLKFYHCPGSGICLPPGRTPGHLTSLSGFRLVCNIWILKLSKMIAFIKLFYDFGCLINTDNAFSVS